LRSIPKSTPHRKCCDAHTCAAVNVNDGRRDPVCAAACNGEDGSGYVSLPSSLSARARVPARLLPAPSGRVRSRFSSTRLEPTLWSATWACNGPWRSMSRTRPFASARTSRRCHARTCSRTPSARPSRPKTDVEVVVASASPLIPYQSRTTSGSNHRDAGLADPFLEEKVAGFRATLYSERTGLPRVDAMDSGSEGTMATRRLANRFLHTLPTP
jgi:hypothetical protein